MTFEAALHAIPIGWSFSHVISIGWLHGDTTQGYQAHLIHPEDNLTVSATGDTPEDAVMEAIDHTYDAKWHQHMISVSDLRAPDEAKFDLMAAMKRKFAPAPMKRRI